MLYLFAMFSKLSTLPPKIHLVEKIIVVPGNGGTAKLAKTRNMDIELSNMDLLVSLAQKEMINLAVPSSEGPLVAGISDCFKTGKLICSEGVIQLTN